MTFWDEDVFDQHPMWGQVDALAGYLDDERLPEDLDPPQRASVVRLKTALELLREHQQKGAKIFYTKSMFDNVDATLGGQVNANLANFVSDSDAYGNAVNDAAVHVESVFAYVAQWPALPAGGQAQAAGRAFSDYKKEAELALEVLQKSKDELETDIATLRTQLAEIETVTASVSDSYTASLGERENEYIEAINRVEASGEEAYDKAIEAEIASRVKKLERFEAAARQHVVDTEKAQHEAEDFALASKDSADWLAQRAVATDFGMQARRKSAAAWVYDVLGAAVIGVPLTFVLLHFLNNQGGTDSTVAVSLTRLSIIVGAVILGGYLFSRGATNHRQARASKSADIRLRTVEAFISKLEPDQQDRIRNGMAENIYLHGRLADDEADSPNPFARMLDHFGAKDDTADKTDKTDKTDKAAG
ncbi:hypothetical protein [Mycobacterium sp. shizuoka-1]|uniref:hypothetical protein n=1 Tax=Mycobacterium sp. shizuoka-1 TaxID=2039281 RepID=UPI00115B0AC2|nr:hypothetical protein [Mycobacterium sp. shizuoka-1]